MSDFFKKMKSVFVETEESVSPEQSDDKSKSAPSTPANSSQPNSPVQDYRSEPPLSEAGKHSDQFYKILFDALERNNQPGFDYLEFKKALQSLENIALDEKTRFISAFAGAQASGTTTAVLLDSAKIYLNVLETEASNFKMAVEQQWQKQIGNRENEINQLHNLIKEKTAQIEKLKTEIEEHSGLLENLNAEISGAQSKINVTKSDFQATYEGLVEKIKGDVDRINSYLIQKQ